ncbi:2-keto-4-pentenoate hydratase/2-oxohepta-3-ene-1,7-dioic acid hydratase (catechol pathway) [Paenibacillus catalpae]|uniref:2-keto-4-pentenoate hydratase/2-oxohepta-3-ene-1,7-dioic acid hydratase (Catechol pathway) n=1 Tax=Paenibacillus catalpae TaxID=1045775 RepID=A0A1I1Y0H7_9BACL|nr:fumarylacetoacetate hydrolase family protein [Paenibacillus catalpae]SFE13167.1 2-keto-4-pentenoate hydratase/2-oxohepta-3-ene-1,7-dioic acid hydratase (catechol pathway) [Paenibacillus catalpae]
MKLVNFREKEASASYRLGVYTDKGIVDAGDITINGLLQGGETALSNLQQHLAELKEEQVRYLNESEVVYGPCVPEPGKIICIGLNYRKHAEETNMPLPEYPILFSKFNNALAAHGEDVPLPKSTQKVDYEAELAIVIGRTAKNVSVDKALDYVFGYCASNDLSARDLQTRTSQWLAGKSCDKFAPIGPYLVSKDEVGDPNALRISCSVNGEVRQDSNTSDMIFNCKEIVSYISQCMTLSPGDIILTGTPEGVVMGYPPEKQVYLQAGDVVTIEIEKLGALTNRMVAVQE